MLLSKGYSLVEDVNENYWDELRVNYERIDEQNPKSNLKIFLVNIKRNERQDLCFIMNLTDFNIESDDIFVNNVSTNSAAKYLLYLREFSNRKKKSIDDYYNRHFSNTDQHYESSDLIKLIHMFFIRPSILFEILVLHEWKSKSTGDLFQCDKKIQSKHLDSIASDVNYERAIIDTLYIHSGKETHYRLLAHCKIANDHYIYLIYRLNKDTKRVDFDRAKRIKDVDIILMSINIKKQILEIKSSTKKEVWGLKKYIQDHIGSKLSDIIEEVYTDYEPSKISRVFKEGVPFAGEEPEDFVMNKVVFSNSLLIKSPEIVIQLPKNDVWISVVDAFKKKVIDINSLRDIKQIKFTANNHSRVVRSVVMENGNVIYKLDDSGIDEQTKNAISDKFKKKFGFPLNQPVENKFILGEAAQIDYLINLSTQCNLTDELQMKFEDLKSKGIIHEKVHVIYSCQETSCGYQSENRDDFADNTCQMCGSDEFANRKMIEYVPNDEEIINQISNWFSEFIIQTPSFVQIKESKYKIIGKEYVFYRFTYKEKPYQLLVTGSIISKKAIEQIERQLIPTIIVYYGIDKEQAALYTPNTIEYIDFGYLYLNQSSNSFSQIISAIIESLEERASLHISTVASKAQVSLKKIIGKTDTLVGVYNENLFEDEVYPIFKDMIPNSEKWGKEYIGKTLPEGVLALQYCKKDGVNKINNNRVFTYDCKFTTKKSGYDLCSGEKRKGTDYVKRLNKLREISSYCTTGQVSAHIFISNKFKLNQIKKMAEYFNSEFGSENKIIPVFIEVDALIHLYSFYNKNKDKILKVPDVFYEQLYSLLTPDDYQVTIEKVDELLDEVLFAADQYKLADTERITRVLIKS